MLYEVITHFVNPLDPVAWDLLDISANALSRIIAQAEPQLEETLSIMGECVR